MKKPMKICINLDNLENLSPEEAEREVRQYNTTMEQFRSAMAQPFAIKGALMPDAHPGYAMPIGGVVATDGVIVPAWVGYDIGCGVSATKFTVHEDTFFKPDVLEGIKERIKERVPLGFKHAPEPVRWLDYEEIPKTKVVSDQFENGDGFHQLGTLGGGNHFIEIGKDEEGALWIVVHSGSRNVGHKTAQHYMRLAANSKKAKEGHFALLENSEEGQNYIKDMTFCLRFALFNRTLITMGVVAAVADMCLPIDGPRNPPLELDIVNMINRNHNHADKKGGLWIHRKGATHAEEGMLGVIPGNMRDGSYIVKGKGNEEFLCSSSHGAGRAYGRKEAKEVLSMDSFKKDMAGIVADVTEGHLDESPEAYKNFNAVMEAQSEAVELVHHIKPIINVKG